MRDMDSAGLQTKHSATRIWPDPLVVNPGRLSILLALAGDGPATATGVEFVDVRQRTRLTDGNLASHARRLATGGLIGVTKQFRAGKPVTSYVLTPAGRDALASHVRQLMAAVDGTAPVDRTETPPRAVAVEAEVEADDDWVD